VRRFRKVTWHAIINQVFLSDRDNSFFLHKQHDDLGAFGNDTTNDSHLLIRIRIFTFLTADGALPLGNSIEPLAC
jgi:hypothetical protein